MSGEVENNGLLSSDAEMDPDANANPEVDSETGGEVLGNQLEVDFVELPAEVKRRIEALRKIQLDIVGIEAKFFNELHGLEAKYADIYKPLFDLRASIISGAYEPTDEECTGAPPIREGSEKVTTGPNKDKSGVPEFWLTVFANCSEMEEMVKDHDIPILKHLTDLSLEVLVEPIMGFKLSFHFSPNDYFTNTVLTKVYEMKCEPDEEDPFGFEGPEIYKCTGCEIDWKAGKNVTTKQIRKKQRHKTRGTRVVTETVPVESFFSFFNPPSVDAENLDEELQAVLTADFEIGQYIRERLIPRAALYFTGEAGDESDEEEYQEEDEEEEEGEEEEEDDEDGYEEEKEVKKPSPRGKTGKKGPLSQLTPEQQQQQCKQQ